MYKGAVFFDYDGTITDENEGIFSPTSKTVYTFEKLRANGYATFLATGRMKPLTTLVSGKFTGLVTCNGAYVEIEGKTVLNKTISPVLQEEAVRYMEQNGICYGLDTQLCGFTNGLSNKHFLSVLEHFKLPKSLYKPVKNSCDIMANKIIITYENEEMMLKMAEFFKGRLVISPHRFCLSADVDAFGMSKAEGVKAVAESLSIPFENIYAVGDGSNDYDMLKIAGHGVAMEKHSDRLDSVAEFVTKSVRDDGIYHAICEHYKLVN